MKTSYKTQVNGKEIEVKWVDEKTLYFGEYEEANQDDLFAWMESFDKEIEEHYRVGNGEYEFAVSLKEELTREEFVKSYCNAD